MFDLLHTIWSCKKRWKNLTSPVSYFLEVFIRTLFLNFQILYSHRFLNFSHYLKYSFLSGTNSVFWTNFYPFLAREARALNMDFFFLLSLSKFLCFLLFACTFLIVLEYSSVFEYSIDFFQ